MLNSILHYKCNTSEKEVLLLVVSREIRALIIHQLLENRIAGHLGREPTLTFTNRWVHWPDMSSDINRWCRQCVICARAKAGPGSGRSSLCRSITGLPLDRVGIDIVGPLPVTNDGNEYIIVLCDYFTKWVETYAVSDHDHQALTVGDKIV